MTLTDDEAADLINLWIRVRARQVGTGEFIAHVTALANSYRAQGYVMGDLAHEATIRAEEEA